MLFESLSDAAAIKRFYATVEGFKGLGNEERHWAQVKLIKRSIEDDLRKNVLKRKLFVKVMPSEPRKNILKEALAESNDKALKSPFD